MTYTLGCCRPGPELRHLCSTGEGRLGRPGLLVTYGAIDVNVCNGDVVPNPWRKAGGLQGSRIPAVVAASVSQSRPHFVLPRIATQATEWSRQATRTSYIRRHSNAAISYAQLLTVRNTAGPGCDKQFCILWPSADGIGFKFRHTRYPARAH